jgi:hypothetical protein
MPGDRVVVRRIETAVVDGEPDPFAWIFDQTAVPGEAREDQR